MRFSGGSIHPRRAAMNASFLVSPSLRGWFAASELAPHIETFVERLVRDGYSCRSAAGHVDSIAHFARWMSRSRLTVERLDEVAIQRFLDRHLPRCDCPPPAHRNRRDLSAGCHLLLRVLRDQGVVPAPVTKPGPVEPSVVFSMSRQGRSVMAIEERSVLRRSTTFTWPAASTT